MSKTETELGQPDWFAVQVKVRWGQSTADILSGKGYETLLPLYKTDRRWGSRVRSVEAPLFPGYVFCRFDVLKRLPILVTPGVLSIVSRGRVPVAVEKSEIAAIQTLVLSGAQAEPWPYPEAGQRVRIEDTALRGLEGIFLAIKGRRRVIVSVSLLRHSVALEIDRALITPLGNSRNAAAAAPPAPPEPDLYRKDQKKESSYVLCGAHCR